MRLREPLRQVEREGVTVRSLQNHVLILIVIEHDVCFIDDWVALLDWLNQVSLGFVWHVKDHLLFSLELKHHTLYVSYVFFRVDVDSAVEGLARDEWGILVEFKFYEGIHICHHHLRLLLLVVVSFHIDTI